MNNEYYCIMSDKSLVTTVIKNQSGNHRTKYSVFNGANNVETALSSDISLSPAEGFTVAFGQSDPVDLVLSLAILDVGDYVT